MNYSRGVSIVVALLLAVGAHVSEAGAGGVIRPGCKEPTCGQPKQPCCPRMKTCKETVYEEQERTYYKPVYTEVIDEKIIDTVQYVEETRYRCRPCTVWQPKPPEPCGACTPVKACGPSGCCAAEKPCGMVPVQIIKKVAYKVMVPKPVQKIEKVPRTVVTMEPYTVTICIPHVICTQVPVCTAEPCCGQPKRCKSACGGR